MLATLHEAMHTSTCQHNQSTEAASQVVRNSADHEVARLQDTTYNIILAFLIHPTTAQYYVMLTLLDSDAYHTGEVCSTQTVVQGH